MDSVLRTITDHLLDKIDKGVPTAPWTEARVAFLLLREVSDLKAAGKSDKEITVHLIDKLLIYALGTNISG